ncbi:hypothetical protein J7K99_00505 [bacterium]|nr:hypothetical protein [bacterium]
MPARRKKTAIGDVIKTVLWAFLLATVFVLITPTPERDTGVNETEKTEFTPIYQKPKGNEAFLNYLRNQGYKITRNNLPTVIEVYKKQVNRDPNEVVQELAETAYRMTGKNVKVILQTWGGKYMAEHSPAPPKSKLLIK